MKALVVLLALLMVPEYWMNVPTIVAYFLIFGLTCLTTSNLALFCSTVFHKSSTSLLATYSVILLLYLVPVATSFFATQYFPQAKATPVIQASTIASPFAAAFEFPIYMDDLAADSTKWARPNAGDPQIFGYPLADLRHFAGYVTFTFILNVILFVLMIWMFNARWRVSTSTG